MPDDVVLDPMMGSGTTILEAQLEGRKALGFDIDPLAIRIARTKTSKLDESLARSSVATIVESARRQVQEEKERVIAQLASRWDVKTKAFVDYWFALDTQIELQAIHNGIALVNDSTLRNFLEVALSSVIITKNGGVSLALDLAHSRPHRAKTVYGVDGKLVVEDALMDVNSPRASILTKKLRSAVDEFEKRAIRNAKALSSIPADGHVPILRVGDSQSLEISDNSIDLIVTSPPYASNAIDYMRAHKFSLVWLGESVGGLTEKRAEYIGGESTSQYAFKDLPDFSAGIVQAVTKLDPKRAASLHRYYSEMTLVLSEMLRVLSPGKSAIVVVGSSVMRGVDTQTAKCLAEIGESIGFNPAMMGVRNLDRGRRMLPAGTKRNHTSQIQQRMHEEYVIGYTKPI